MIKNILSLLLLFIVLPEIHAQQKDKPNILWIVSEDNSPFLGCYGDTFATTPHLDKFAKQGILYKNAFATAPVCAPSRFTLVTGMYPPSMGTEHMRSTYPVPDYVKFFPRYLREAGYYTTNNAKKDYNTTDQPEAWDESSAKATYKNRKPGQPFFAVFNLNVSHESSIHTSIPTNKLKHDPEKVNLPPYHPATPEMKHDWAQYYDKIEEMDRQVGALLKELEAEGQAENTIIFYYSDNGGILGRSKRFLYESGLRVPLIIRFPEKYARLAPNTPGTETDRIVTFNDFAPTVLSLAGLEVPSHMQGKAFLGAREVKERAYAYGFRGRMDERTDLSRSVRDKKFRYIRNYLPHIIYGQYLEYLWKAPSIASWEAKFKAGRLNEDQKKFWQEKPAEELFDIENDPHNIHNLAGDPSHKEVLLKLRKANHDWLIETQDVGFIPEPLLGKIAETTPLRDYAKSGKYELNKIIETAEIASSRDKSHLKELVKRLGDKDAVVRYWAVIGTIILKNDAMPAKAKLQPLLNDPEVVVRIAAAEALLALGDTDAPVQTLNEALKSESRMARVQALNVLENIGAKAQPAFENVKALLTGDPKDTDYDVRAAKKVLETE
ncbi:sulfatase-like hydrolase/transferase [Dyadobacter chenwenxiniae]|uniref:Sulfatase-like hydrolase/transferase n=1 Tax=Dyadobacter chenwenxiniae TaxID=2906456 RepID=A0A9X1PRS0_9BACT|nr:sulfatase [Dyadobacter chenwenxiniae]MCF0065254.1 sulfatase-like hydrolase/transferase [Dyadobacter chenwenxiniae]UON84477.1 sulfatase-like hydrolase/transferase [Dyadobacter chenwenxiniae]